MDDFKGDRKLQNNQWYTNYYRDCFSDYETHLNSSLVLQQLQEKLQYLDIRFPKRGRLLDIGCATGVFLDMAQKQGWTVEGVEISPDLASYAKEKFSLRVHATDVTHEKLSSAPFNAITLFDVIEHLPNPGEMIRACNELIVDDGLLLIRTPVEEGLLRDIAKSFFWASCSKCEFPMLWFYSYEHIQSFSMQSLTTLLKKYGFSVVKIFREEESLDRLNIPKYLKSTLRGVNLFSKLLHKQHKVTLVAQKQKNH